MHYGKRSGEAIDTHIQKATDCNPKEKNEDFNNHGLLQRALKIYRFNLGYLACGISTDLADIAPFTKPKYHKYLSR